MPNLPRTRRDVLALLAAAPMTAHAQTGQPLEVLASFTILADLARAIGGTRLRVASLVGPNQDSHSYQPRPSDVRAVGAAKVMIINGLGFEGWVERLASSAGFKGVPVVASVGVKPLRVGESGNRNAGHGHGGHDHGSVDPHAWQDVANVKVYVGNIQAGLTKADPANAAHYAAAALAYQAQLDRLDAEIRAAWAVVPRERRRIVTSHDAFTYYGDAYDVDLFSPQGISAKSDPTPREIAALIAQIRKANIRALFVENMANEQMLRQVARETGVRIGPAVYSDALSAPTGSAPTGSAPTGSAPTGSAPTGSAPTGPAGSYLDMMRHNTRSFIGALG